MRLFPQSMFLSPFLFPQWVRHTVTPLRNSTRKHSLNVDSDICALYVVVVVLFVARRPGVSVVMGDKSTCVKRVQKVCFQVVAALPARFQLTVVPRACALVSLCSCAAPSMITSWMCQRL